MFVPAALTALALLTAAASATAPRALVYRGPAACDGCPEAVAHLLRTAPTAFNVSYVGPAETLKLSRATLSTAAVYAQPGGGGVSRTWPHVAPHRAEIRDWVAAGGLYLGHCLGAYFAGTPGFDFLGAQNTNEEVTQPGAQVTSRKNTIIQVDWHFASGRRAGTTENNRWLFFQDGAVMAPRAGDVPNATILARYSSNGDVAALVKGFGKGRIGLTGPHPEATESWYEPYDFTNPDGINFKYGWDLVEALYHGPKSSGSVGSGSAPHKQNAGGGGSGEAAGRQLSSGWGVWAAIACALAFSSWL